MTENNLIELDNYRSVEDIVKRRLDSDYVVICYITKDGLFGTFIPSTITDIDLTYMIDCLIERKRTRLE